MTFNNLLSTRIFSFSFAPIILVVGGLLLYLLLRRVLLSRSSGKRTIRYFFFFDLLIFPAVLILLLVFLNRYDPRFFTSTLRMILLSLLILCITWLLNRFLQLFFWSDYFEKKYGSPAPRIIPNIVAVVLYLLAVYFIMTSVFERPLSGLLVSTGVLVGVIGLALQNLISDFFYGFSITLENPFYKGDWIELSDGNIGQVVEISWHAIHLLSFNNSIYIVPNSSIARNTVHNLSRPTRKYALWMTVSVDSAYPPEQVRLLLTEAALSCSAVLTEPMPSINLSDASGNPYVYTVYVYFRDFISHYRGKNDLYMAIHQRLERAGILPSSAKFEVATAEAPKRTFTTTTIQEELAATELFSPLSREDIVELAAGSYERTFHPGDTVIEEGEVDNSLLIISSGVVEVVKKNSRGREVNVDRLGVGDFIGEMSLMTGRPRSATVRALVTVRGIIVPKEALETILQRNPSLSEQIAGKMVERKMQDPQFSKIVKESPAPTSRLLKLYMDKIGLRISEFFKIRREKG